MVQGKKGVGSIAEDGGEGVAGGKVKAGKGQTPGLEGAGGGPV